MAAPINATICLVKKKDKLLMKMQIRGDGNGKWSFPGGKIMPGESPLECAIRETFEETGIRARNLTKIGVFKFYVEGKGLNYIVHVFSPKTFSGTPKSTKEGKVKWVNVNRLPYNQMWDGDKYWLPLMLQGNKFDAKFYYDKENKKTLKYEITLRR